MFLAERICRSDKIHTGNPDAAGGPWMDVLFSKQFCRMIHNLGLKICIEGVENQEEWAKIQKLEPDFGQGFFWGRPCGYDEFVRQFIEKK